MASDLESWLRIGQIDCSRRGLSIGHQRGGGNNACSIAFDDCPVYARGKAKIICINDETTHWLSLTKKHFTKIKGAQSVLLDFPG